MQPKAHMIEAAVAECMKRTGMQYMQALRHVQQSMMMRFLPQQPRRIG